MGYIQGEGRNQGTLFPVVLDDFVPADHVCRVIDSFVEKLVMSELGFEHAQAAETGRLGYDPHFSCLELVRQSAELFPLFICGGACLIECMRVLHGDAADQQAKGWIFQSSDLQDHVRYLGWVA
jgi:hypothetical protein